MDTIKRAMLFEGKAIVDVLDTTEIVQQAINFHNLSDDAAKALGQILTIGAFISSGFKSNGNKLTIIVDGKGNGGKIVVSADTGAKVRGYIQNTRAMGDIQSVIGRDGYINVIKDFGLKEPYNGLSEIVTGTPSMDFAYYFTKSEQLPSAISLDVDVKNGKCLKSAGIIVQPMPNCTEEVIVILEDIVSQMKNIASIVEEKGAQGVIDFYFSHFPIKQLDDVNPSYVCSCSKEKVSQMLVTLGKEELQSIVKENGKIEVGCQFCNKKYQYFEEDIEKLF